MTLKEEFVSLRKRYIEQKFASLNEVQRDAVFSTEGPLLILAGAGSGKTTVVVNRIKYIIEFGSAYCSDEVAREVTEQDVALLKQSVMGTADLAEELRPLMRVGAAQPWNILAITFTNKAAGELKDRICASIGERGRDVFASTFHSACVRFLRRDADRLGFPQNFTIYDTDDSQRILKEIYKELGVDEKLFPPRQVHGRLGRIKDEMLSPDEFAERANNYNDKTIARIYAAYQKRLRAAGAFDFDDLIYFTVELLRGNPEVRDYYHSKFRYIMVDEYQDTSYAQYRLCELLTGPRRNLCVVGDDDQSIYRFRGATIENILGFEEAFGGAKVIRLEQNYRSTGNILEAANEVIAHNRGRKGKTLWTSADKGELIHIYCADTERDEAVYVASQIAKNQSEGVPLKQQAVLYRMNAQSNAVENYFARAGIPYRIIGGLRFYDRAEIKDIMAYLCVVDNPGDNLRLTRIINRPARKVGDATVQQIQSIADGLGVPMLEVIRDAADYPALSRAKNALAAFYQLYERLCELYHNNSLTDFVAQLIDETGYRAMLLAMKEEGATKLENVEELLSSIRSFEAENPEGDLALFLEEIALVSSIDSYDENTDAVVLMTMHSAKGLEFDCVYIIGLEEGIFPGEMSRYSEADMEEERRLAYVGITRARKKLYLTRAAARMLFGSTRRNPESRFLAEFPDELKYDEAPRRSMPTYRDKDRIESRGQYEYRKANEFSNYKLEHPGAGGGSASGSGQHGFGSAAGTAGGKRALGESLTVGPNAPRKSAAGTRFAAGDRVEHKIFGPGVVVSATPLGGDLLLEIDFDRSGVKKAMANYAPLTKIS